MKYSLLTFFILFTINNLLHYISEKIIIVIFITFLFFLMGFLSNLINVEFKSKIQHLLQDINTYMNVVFNFLYINKLFYLNLYFLSSNSLRVSTLITKKLVKVAYNAILKHKILPPLI